MKFNASPTRDPVNARCLISTVLSQPLHIFRDAEHSPVAAADAAAGSPASATVPLDLVHEGESTAYKTMSAESAMQQAYG